MSKECVDCVMKGNIKICINCVYYPKTKVVNNFKPKNNYAGRMEVK